MDRAPPRGAPRDAVGQRWLAVFAFQAVLSAAASALHLAASPRGRRHPHLGVPAGLLLALHPLLACAATGLVAQALATSRALAARRGGGEEGAGRGGLRQPRSS